VPIYSAEHLDTDTTL